MTPRMKILCAAALLAVWGVLVMCKMSPASDYATGLRDALVSLGVFTATITNPTPKE